MVFCADSKEEETSAVVHSHTLPFHRITTAGEDIHVLLHVQHLEVECCRQTQLAGGWAEDAGVSVGCQVKELVNAIQLHCFTVRAVNQEWLPHHCQIAAACHQDVGDNFKEDVGCRDYVHSLKKTKKED